MMDRETYLDLNRVASTTFDKLADEWPEAASWMEFGGTLELPSGETVTSTGKMVGPDPDEQAATYEQLKAAGELEFMIREVTWVLENARTLITVRRVFGGPPAPAPAR